MKSCDPVHLPNFYHSLQGFSSRAKMQDPSNYEKHLIFKDDDDTVIPELICKMAPSTGDAILDFGCGTGEATLYCFRQLAEERQLSIFGLDISRSVIEYAREHHSHPCITYFVADLVRDGLHSLPRAQFDHIFSYYVLYWIQDYRLCMKLLFDALKPGGRFVFGVPIYSSPFTVFDRILNDPSWTELVTGSEVCIPAWYKEGDLTGDSLKRAILDAGFEIQEYNVIRRQSPGTTLDSLADFCCSVHPSTASIPSDRLAEFRNTILQHLKNLSQEPNQLPPLESDVAFAVLAKPSTST